MFFKIHPFEIKHRHFPNKKGFILEKEGRLSEVAPLPGRSTETFEEALEQLQAVQKGWRGSLYPSVEFGLYGLSAPSVSSIPCALFLYGTTEEVLQTAAESYGCTVAKLKVGHWHWTQALEVIKALPFQLRIDFNHCWTRADVEKLCSHLSPAQIDFLEDAGCQVLGFTQASDETPSVPSLRVWKPSVQGLPPPQKKVILSSSLESSIGLQHIAALTQSHQIYPHVLGLGTILHLEKDLVQNSAFIKEGKLHFPQALC